MGAGAFMCRWGRSCGETPTGEAGTEGTEGTERALKTETRGNGDGYAGDHRSAADACSVSSVLSVPGPAPSMTYFQPLDFREARRQCRFLLRWGFGFA